MSNNTLNGKPAPGNGPYIVQQNVVRSASITAAVTYTINNPGYHTRLNIYWNIHSFPGSASTTIAMAINAIEPVNAATFNLLSPAARSATGTVMYAFGNVTTSAPAATNCALPNKIQLALSLSTGATSKDVVFSIGVEWLP